MADDNVIPFPQIHRDAIDEDEWQHLQAEFYLDCFSANHGHAPEGPAELRAWLQQVELFAETDNAFFRGWLLRRLSSSQA